MKLREVIKNIESDAEEDSSIKKLIIGIQGQMPRKDFDDEIGRFIKRLTDAGESNSSIKRRAKKIVKTIKKDAYAWSGDPKRISASAYFLKRINEITSKT